MVVRWYHTWIVEGPLTPGTLSVIRAPGPPHRAEISRVEVRNIEQLAGSEDNWSTCILREILLAKKGKERSSIFEKK